MRKFTFFLLALVCSAGFMQAEVHSGACGDNLQWSYDDVTKVLSFSGYGAMTDYNAYDMEYYAPWYAYHKDITSIDWGTSTPTTIGITAFYNCTGLTSVTIPNSVTEIKGASFMCCFALTSVDIHAGVTVIGGYVEDDFLGGRYRNAFDGCYALTDITVAADNTAYSSEDGVLFNKDKSTLVQYPCGKTGAYVIPDGVTTLGKKAFDCCSGLTSLTIPASVYDIDANGAYMEDPFFGCTALNEVNNYATTPQYLSEDHFSTVDKDNITLHVVYGYKDVYEAAYVWKDFGRIVADLEDKPVLKKPEVYTEYAAGVLTYYYDTLRSERTGTCELYAPSVDRFNGYADQVTKAVIDPSMANANLTSTERMFYGGFGYELTALTTIEGLENLNTANVTTMKEMFGSCNSLTSLKLSTFDTQNVTNMNSMFASCNNMKTVNIAKFDISNVKDMRFMFTGCTALETIYCNTDWSSSTAQATYMFLQCTSLVGGQGTAYDSNVTENKYARPDGGTAAPGYFTEVSTEGIEGPTSDSSLKGRANKVLRNGMLYIEHNGRIYTLQGAVVE